MENSTTKWALWRQDDNGNKFFVQIFTSKEKAIKTKETYEAKGHKQVYWLETIQK